MRSGYLDFFKEKLRNRRVFVDTSIILCYKIHKKNDRGAIEKSKPPKTTVGSGGRKARLPKRNVYRILGFSLARNGTRYGLSRVIVERYRTATNEHFYH